LILTKRIKRENLLVWIIAAILLDGDTLGVGLLPSAYRTAKPLPSALLPETHD
jgi:hypothetical protein